ncbi:MAG: diguanylate cyclase [Candidatus Goldiibacteriota bacterium]|jgi:diguanylate cyclase (GGDEF)-like protein
MEDRSPEKLEKEIRGLKEDIAKLKKLDSFVQEKYEDLLKKEEAYLGEINESIERELTVIILGTVKKTINKEMTALKMLRRHLRNQVRRQVVKDIKNSIDHLIPEIKHLIKEEVRKVSLDIMNQLKRQTGKQLEKEVVEQIKESTSALIEQKEESERRAIIDQLTGAFNRRYFETRLEEELNLAKRFRNSMCLVMFDIDFFKRVNDTYGHQAGDTVLQEVVVAAKSCLSSADFLCRYGGEEFAVIMPETKISEAIDIAERIRKSIEEHTFYGGETLINITISLGISEYPEHAILKEAIIAKADGALYTAKKSGRNNTKIAIK